MMALRPIPALEMSELLVALDGQIALLEARLDQLERMAQAIIARDDASLESLLAAVEASAAQEAQAHGRLAALRRRIGRSLGLEEPDLRLSRLAALVPPEQAVALEPRRRQMVTLAHRLRRQHMRTAVLLCECVRLNRMLLASLLPGQCELTTYGARGADSWRGGAGLMDAEV